jgi:hypothetical protein
MPWSYHTNALVEAMLLGISLKSLERKLEEAEEGGNIEPREASRIRRALARGKRRVAALEKEAGEESVEKLERNVQRLADLLADADYLSEEEYEELLAQHDEALALLESLRQERAREQARRAAGKRGARLLASMRQEATTRKSATPNGEGRGYWCIDCGRWHPV